MLQLNLLKMMRWMIDPLLLEKLQEKQLVLDLQSDGKSEKPLLLYHLLMKRKRMMKIQKQPTILLVRLNQQLGRKLCQVPMQSSGEMQHWKK